MVHACKDAGGKDTVLSKRMTELDAASPLEIPRTQELCSENASDLGDTVLFFAECFSRAKLCKIMTHTHIDMSFLQCLEADAEKDLLSASGCSQKTPKGRPPHWSPPALPLRILGVCSLGQMAQQLLRAQAAHYPQDRERQPLEVASKRLHPRHVL